MHDGQRRGRRREGPACVAAACSGSRPLAAVSVRAGVRGAGAAGGPRAVVAAGPPHLVLAAPGAGCASSTWPPRTSTASTTAPPRWPGCTPVGQHVDLLRRRGHVGALAARCRALPARGAGAAATAGRARGGWTSGGSAALEPIMRARFAMCAHKGFDAVEPDNMDGFENPTGFPISAAQQLAYDRLGGPGGPPAGHGGVREERPRAGGEARAVTSTACWTSSATSTTSAHRLPPLPAGGQARAQRRVQALPVPGLLRQRPSAWASRECSTRSSSTARGLSLAV